MTLVEWLQLLFWLSAAIIFWTYLGYYLFLEIIAAFYSRPVDKGDITPSVSIVITAYNESRRIKEKLDNSLDLDYPAKLREIIVVSDGSTDGTDDIVANYKDIGVQLLRIPEHRGKHYAQGRGIAMASADIVVISDATTFLSPDAIRKIVRNFADPTVGVVSGEDRILGASSEESGEGAYVQYEMKLRNLESKVCSLIGCSGSFSAFRKEIAADWIDDMSADFYLPIMARKMGLRTVHDSEAYGHYSVQRSAGREFNRKVRTVLHGLEVLFKFKSILNPLRYGFYSFQMISHKLMRWLVPFALLAMIVANALLLSESDFFRVSMAGQLLLYLAAALGASIKKLQDSTMFKIPLFFVMVNIAIVMAWVMFWKGEQRVVWSATRR